MPAARSGEAKAELSEANAGTKQDKAAKETDMTRQVLTAFAVCALVFTTVPAKAQENESSWLPSLLTDTPEQGFDLAVSMARRAVKTTQTDVDTLHKMRPAYANDPDSLIHVSGVIAAYFATVAEANGYWRD
ncbi:hexameric tyrosine-coordinated heme protein (HTHP) [Rhodovulum euryhalinum]|uniref:Hexameric tyrosine-coordinated heme protein (HTHP) n=2 Tax=Rhodovulum euryhalinum TaxID=35805 RepID=A0A4R2KEI3_9RHOB|nr:hexameric tyrosine-coordinated heme protein (HTHP) [Rhodovulum euryhalinum]